MKKILSLLLVGVMVFSMIPAAYAQNVYENPDENTDMGTTVAATGELTTVNEDGTVSHDVSYTIKVPAKMAPGDEGTVYLEGYWPSDATVKVTADASVDMVNDITNANKKTLAVTFTPIELAGNNEAAVADDEAVSVADIENALFGSWSGVFHYNVEYVAGASGDAGDSGATGGESGGTTVEPGEGQISFTIDGTSYLADENMSWTQWVESDYNTAGVSLASGFVMLDQSRLTYSDTNTPAYPNDTIRTHDYILVS